MALDKLYPKNRTKLTEEELRFPRDKLYPNNKTNLIQDDELYPNNKTNIIQAELRFVGDSLYPNKNGTLIEDECRAYSYHFLFRSVLSNPKLTKFKINLPLRTVIADAKSQSGKLSGRATENSSLHSGH